MRFVPKAEHAMRRMLRFATLVTGPFMVLVLTGIIDETYLLAFFG